MTKIKTKINGEHALNISFILGRSTSGSFSSSCHLVNKTVIAIEQSEPTIAGNSAPTNLAAITWGIAMPSPDIKVIKPTPLTALMLPSVKITKINGTSNTKTNNCKVTMKDKFSCFKLVTSANVKIGKPIAPNAVAVVLAIKLITDALIGSNPKAIKILAAIATAVPKPAIDSRKPPKPQAIISTIMRLSVEIVASMF